MEKYLSHLLGRAKINTTKTYLVATNVVLAVFAIVFSNAGMLPFKSFADFAFFAVLALMLAIYRPGWACLFFIGSLALENINLAPVNIPLSIRPYQFMALITIIALIVGFSTKRLKFDLPKWKWIDALPIVFAVAGFASAVFSIAGPVGEANLQPFKQAAVATSFAVIYFLVRVYVQNWNDLKRIAPFFLSSGIVVALYGILQNIRFARGLNAFEVMPGRPNGTFTEADWFGIFLVFVIAVAYSAVYFARYKIQDTRYKQISNANIQIPKNAGRFGNVEFGDWIFSVSCILFLVISYIALILTVSRSAWLGAVIVTLPFLKLTALKGTSVSPNKKAADNLRAMFRLGKWDWKGFGIALMGVVFSLVLSIGIVYIFHLTTFQIGSRAVSTGGLQKITIACEAGRSVGVPTNISSVEELAQYGCRHINLEEVESEKSKGESVLEVYRPDPNVGIRAKSYGTSWQEIKKHPVFGIGWGSIGDILGRDERGAALNASNIFLETWLGAGILGFLSLVILLGYLLFGSIANYVKGEQKTSVFVMLATIAIIIPNLFNSGIFLGFVWAYLAVAVSLLQKET